MTVQALTTLRNRYRIQSSSRTLALGAAAIVFITLCALPIFYMLCASLINSEGTLSLDNYRGLLAEPRQRSLLLNSSMLATGTAALATGIGAPLGLFLARVEMPVKQVLRLALVIPLVIPTYINGLAWMYLGGSSGFIARALGSDLLSSWTYSLTGAVIVLAISFYPLSMLATEAAARKVDGRLEEAALLVAQPRRVFWKITLPLIAPSVTASALIIFVLTLAEFGVPGLLRVPVFTTEVFTAFSARYNFGVATALAVPLVTLAILAGVFTKLLLGERPLTTRRITHAGLALSSSRWRGLLMGAVMVVLLVSVVLPIATLAVEVGQLQRLITAVQSTGKAIRNSLSLSTVGATLGVTVGVLLGYGRARLRSPLKGFLDLSFLAAFAIPGTVVGIGLIGLWNRAGVMGEVYRSPFIIVMAYLARFVPVAALILAASASQVPRSFEEAAEMAGSRWTRTFIRIIVPQMRTGILAAWVVSFIFAFGELGTTLLVSPPGESTLPARIYTLIANAPSSEVAALALLQSGIVAGLLVLLGIFVSPEARRG